MKVAVLGASGMLGSMLVDYLSPRFDVTGTTRADFDALKPDWSVLTGCEWIINAIGIIPQRSQDTKLMLRVNCDFPHILRGHTSAKIIHIATDCVFSGNRGNYDEDAYADPVDAYGKSKRRGEVQAHDFYNLRCSIIGREPNGHYSLLSWFLSQPQGATVDGFFNHWWNGISTLQFAQICEGIMNTKTTLLPQVQHIVPANSCSKGQLLEYFKEAFDRRDIIIRMKQTEKKDRRLATINPANNALLWRQGGYEEIPTIKAMVSEFAKYKAREKVAVA